MKNIRCPRCGASERLLVQQADGSIKCLQCSCIFTIRDWVPKLGVKDLKPPRYLGVDIRRFIDLMRPFSLIAAGLAGFFLVLLCSTYYNTSFSFGLALLCGLTLALLQAGGQAFNQSLKEEIELDRQNQKIYRPTVQGLITPTEGKLFSCLLFILGISLAFALNARFGLFSIIITFFAIFYTAPPLRVKKRFLANNLWQGVARGFLPILAVSYGLFAAGNIFPICMGAVIAVWASGSQTTKDFGGDEVGDRKFGIRTLPVVLGRHRAVGVMAVFIAVSFMLLLGFVSIGFLPPQLLLLLVLIVPSWLILANLRTMKTAKLLENNLSWGIFYGTLGLWYVLPAIILLSA